MRLNLQVVRRLDYAACLSLDTLLLASLNAIRISSGLMRSVKVLRPDRFYELYTAGL